MMKAKYHFREDELFSMMHTIFEGNLHFLEDVGQIEVKSECVVPDVHFAQFNCLFHNTTQLYMETESSCDYVLFSFIREGGMQSKMDCWSDYEEFYAGRFSMVFSPELKGVSQYFSNYQSSGSGIYISVSQVRSLLEQDPRASVKNLFSKLMMPSEAEPFLLHGIIDTNMLSALNRLEQVDSLGLVNGFARKAIVMELLQYALDALINQHCQTDAHLKLTLKDIEKLELARKILNQSLQNAPSLTCLAKQVGLNDFKLKKGFKQLNQRTVHDYLLSQRLNTAAELLAESRLPIIEIAHQVGYNNHGHFSVAFRKKFGCTPSQYRH